jgi:hypothetical protein
MLSMTARWIESPFFYDKKVIRHISFRFSASASGNVLPVRQKLMAHYNEDKQKSYHVIKSYLYKLQNNDLE